MEERFNGQINISRDLRLNKQIEIGKFDLTNIIFLSSGVITAILISYILGFSPFKIVDELTAIFISLIPMSLILSFGFRKVADLRQFDYIRMQQIDKKNKFRLNRTRESIRQKDKYIVPVVCDIKNVNKYLNLFLDYKNLKLLSIRYQQGRVIFLLDFEYTNVDIVFEDIMKKFCLNKELKSISIEEIEKLEEILLKRFSNNEIVVYMLNIYKEDNYRVFIDKVKEYAEVIQYIKKEDNVKYVNTFLIIEKEVLDANKKTKLEKIENLCSEYEIILDRLTKEQNIGKLAVSYLMMNLINAYRVFKQ